MSGHGHGHGHGHGCGCEGEHEPAERGLEYGLYRRIDLEKLQCLNESRDGDGKQVFKPWDQRNERDKVNAARSRCPAHLSGVSVWSSDTARVFLSDCTAAPFVSPMRSNKCTGIKSA